MTLQQSFDNFIFSRRIQGLADKSIDCYMSFIKPFVAHIGTNADIFTINRDLVNTYIEMLLKRQISRATVATYIRYIKIFLKWLEEAWLRVRNCCVIAFSSHKLRHNFATNYCINQYEQHGKVDIYSLMFLMGHEDVETTQRYLHFAQQIIATKSTISHLDNLLITS